MRTTILKNENQIIADCGHTIQSIDDAPWQKFCEDESLEALHIAHVLPLLTSMEADLAMLNWFELLKVNGEIQVVVPDMDYYAKLWLTAEWNENELTNAASEGRQAFAAIWGQQANGNPRDNNYHKGREESHKSGYNSRRLSLLLARAGFCAINVESDNGVLTASAKKTMRRGERQIATTYDTIREDHKNRYDFAAEYIGYQPEFKLLDLACGIGYGSLMLSDRVGAQVTGVDIDQGAINHAREFFSCERTEFINQDARKINFSRNQFDAVISFETIEHVTFDQQLINQFYEWLKPEGILICSTPNEDVMPFDPERFKFHVKHYTNNELRALLTAAGFTEVKLYTQTDFNSGRVEEGESGCFTIAVAKKR